MIKVIPNLPNHIIGFEVSGIVSAEDYETILIPTIDAAASADHKLRLLYHINSDFEKFDFGAVWDDAKVGLQHLMSWDRIAVVTDVEWVSLGIKTFGFAVPSHLRSFANAELSDAVTWLTDE